MNIAVIFAPYTFARAKRGAASLHIGHAISILKNECGANKVNYIDYNATPFFMYSNMIVELSKRKEIFPIDLLYIEKLDLLNRLAVEEIFGVGKNRTNDVYQIDSELIEQIALVLSKVLFSIVEKVNSQDYDAVLLYVSPDISYSLVLCKLMREKNKKIPIIILDNYTFEPATPYFVAPLTRQDLYGNSVEPMLSYDPLIPVLRQHIPELIDYIIIGEGYDILRTLFNSKAGADDLNGLTYTVNGEFFRRKVTSFPFPSIRDGVTILHSAPVQLDSLPLPDFAEMRNIFDSAEFELVRGCSYSCMFCERTGMFGSNLRFHSLEYMERLIRHLLSYNFVFYNSIDTAMNLDETLTIRFLQMLKTKNLSFPYQANLRGRRPNRELIGLLYETGCHEIAIGIETGDDLLLKRMNKVQNLAILSDLTNCINENHLKLMLFLILGYPTESLESVNRTISFISQLNSSTGIDIVELEHYHAGHIQKLGPKNFNQFGIEWSEPNNMKTIERSSRLFLNPGIYGQAFYKYGMTRNEIEFALETYVERFSKMGIKLATCHAK